MASSPAEYLPLSPLDGPANFSEYAAGGSSPGSTVRTTYSRLRIDPSTLSLQTSDQRFSTSTGQLTSQGSTPVTSMPFAAATSCAPGSLGTGSIDLRGTPFSLTDGQLAVTGGDASAILSDSLHQTYQFAASATCGTVASLGGIANAYNQKGGVLKLKYALPAALPATCAQVRQGLPVAVDGLYVLFAGGDLGKPWMAWCQDMAGTPLEYLPLASTGPDANYSQYTAGGSSYGSTVRTTFSRLRIDPSTFTVNTSDQRFSSSSGQLTHSGDRNNVVTSMPYASAMDCVGGSSSSGRASLDLRGTPFSVAPNQFSTGGYSASGGATSGDQNQTMQLQGGGYCGWTSIRGIYQPMGQNGGSLRLQYLAAPALPATCAQVRQLLPGAPNGLYPLFIGGDPARPWIAWCQDMASNPLEYLPLPNPSANVSEFLAGAAASGSSVRTTYSKLRIDPSSFDVNTSDQRFATSTGQLSFAGDQVTSMPLGSSLGCDPAGHTGLASIDLRGTSFALLPQQFSTPGGTAGGVLTGNNDQTLRIQDGVPTCGWVAPPGQPQPMNQGGASLALRHAATFLPATCTQVRQAFPRAGDGHYTLYVGGVASKPWKAWCQDMAGTPTEYLSLAPLGSSANFSEYLAGGLAQGSSVRTVYTRLRIDPASLVVNTADQHFSTSSGQLTQGGTTVSSMPYASAMNCNLQGATGQGSIDLRGTPFSVDASRLASGGTLSRGSAVASQLGQTVQLQGGGSCGWLSLNGVSNPINQNGGSLPLMYGPASN